MAQTLTSARRQAKDSKHTYSSGAGQGSRNALARMPKGAELEELVSTSRLVPEGNTKNSERVLLTPATTAPSSAEPSPLLTFMTEDQGMYDAAWPSLREGVNGWDFCSDADSDSDLWEELPGPAIQDAEIAGLPATSAAEIREGSLADMLRRSLSADDTAVKPPAFGARMPAPSTQALMRIKGDEEEGLDAKAFEVPAASRHGWTKKDKSSWNKKEQRKVAARVAQRAAQSCKNRGWVDEEA